MAWGKGACLLALSQGFSAGGVLPLHTHDACGPVPSCTTMVVHTTVKLLKAVQLSGPAVAVTASWTSWRGSCLSQVETS